MTLIGSKKKEVGPRYDFLVGNTDKIIGRLESSLYSGLLRCTVKRKNKKIKKIKCTPLEKEQDKFYSKENKKLEYDFLLSAKGSSLRLLDDINFKVSRFCLLTF